MTFGTKITETPWLSDGEKFLRIRLFVSTKCTNVTDRQTDGRTRDSIVRACIASRGKNLTITVQTQSNIEI